MMRMYGNSQRQRRRRAAARRVQSGTCAVRDQHPCGRVQEQYRQSRAGSPRILASAGVDASYEAVVISGAGLTKESALAFVMLEKLGQKKVSVFMDSMESAESRLDKLAQTRIRV